eukprot:gene11976-8550_t
MSFVSPSELFQFLVEVKKQFDAYSENNRLVQEVVYRVRLLLALFSNHQQILLDQALLASSRPLSADEAHGKSVDLGSDLVGLAAESAYVLHVRHCEASLADAAAFCDKFFRRGWVRELKKLVLARSYGGSFARLVQDLQSKLQEAQQLFSVQQQLLRGRLQSATGPGAAARDATPALAVPDALPTVVVEENVAQAIAAAEEGFKATFLTLVNDEAADELVTLLDMAAADRDEVIQTLLVPDGDVHKTQEVTRVFEEMTAAAATGRWGAADVVEQTLTRLKDALHRLEPPIAAERLHIDVGQQLGAGAFAKVYRGVLREGASWRRSVAVKLLDVHPDDAARFGREVAVLRALNDAHQACAVQFYGWARVALDGGSDLRVALVLELCAAPLHRALVHDDHFAFVQDRVHVLRQVAAAMAFLASRGLVHRDLKPENVLLRRSNDPARPYGDAVLADFGLAVTADTLRSMRTQQRQASGHEGTRPFMAPELGREAPSELSDVFAFGVTAAFVLRRQLPFNAATPTVTDETLRRFYGALALDEVPADGRATLALLCQCCHASALQRPRFATLQAAVARLSLSTTTAAPADHPSGAVDATLTAAPAAEETVRPLAALTAQEAAALLRWLGGRPRRDSGGGDVDGDWLQCVEDLEALQAVEGGASAVRRPKLQAVLRRLRDFQANGVPAAALVAALAAADDAGGDELDAAPAAPAAGGSKQRRRVAELERQLAAEREASAAAKATVATLTAAVDDALRTHSDDAAQLAAALTAALRDVAAAAATPATPATPPPADGAAKGTKRTKAPRAKRGAAGATLDRVKQSLGSDGAADLAAQLRTDTAVGCLKLGRNAIGDAGAAALAEALTVNRSVHTLCLERNDIGATGVAALAQVLQVNDALSALDLAHNAIGDAGAVALADALRANDALTTLDLAHNAIGDAGAVALADALRANDALSALDLAHNAIGDAGAVALADALRANDALTARDLAHNAIGDEGAVALAAALQVNDALTALDLAHNAIGDEGAKALAAAFEQSLSLQKLSMRANAFGPVGAQALTEAASKRVDATIQL